METLSEALKIAAVDVAEAAQMQMMMEEEEEEGEEVEGEEYFEGGKEKEKGNTIVVNEDGTFEKR